MLRLVALRAIYGEFCEAKWKEKTESVELYYAADELDINRFALGLLAGPLMEGNIHRHNESNLVEAAVIASSEALRTELFQCLQRAYGGATGFYLRLSRTASDSEDQAEDEDEDQVEDADESEFDLSDGNLEAFDFINNGGRR